jgi:superoxide dismutase, Fe-Mn family
MAYAKKDYSKLKGMEGFSDKALDTHFALYEGYVNNTNKLLELFSSAEKDSPQYAELKRRLGWEWNGMRLHEFYFAGLGGSGEMDKSGNLYKALEENFGSYDAWESDFIATAKMRGIGWTILYQDKDSGKLINFWINEHDTGHPAGLNLILNLDVFEHAFFVDYGKDRAAYIDAFMKNINWEEIGKRLK